MLDLNETRYLYIAFIVGFILLFKPWLHGIDSPGVLRMGSLSCH